MPKLRAYLASPCSEMPMPCGAASSLSMGSLSGVQSGPHARSSPMQSP